MNKLTCIRPTSLLKFDYQYRCLSTTQIVLGKELGFDKNKIDSAESLMENAPKWDEANATESEADVKADKEKDINPEILKQETAEWIDAHKDAQGNIRK